MNGKKRGHTLPIQSAKSWRRTITWSVQITLSGALCVNTIASSGFSRGCTPLEKLSWPHGRFTAGPYLQYNTQPANVITYYCWLLVFAGNGWYQGKSFLAPDQWLSLVSSCYGNADSRSNLEPPYGIGVDEIAALSLLSDSGARLFQQQD